MRVLVTGAQGCIGAWVVRKLLDRGIDTLIFDMDPNPTRLALIASPDEIARVAVRTGRIEDTNAMKSVVRDERITHVIHLAAQLMPYCQQNPVAGGMVNVIGTLNVFEAARDAGRAVRVVYASSAAVWGPAELYGDRDLTEEDAVVPATHYGVFKHANEGNARVFFATNGVSSVGLRPWTVYGVGRDKGLTGDPSLAIQAVALGEPFHIRLSGAMDFQYVEDVADTFAACALSNVEGAHVFNLRGVIATIEEFKTALAGAEPAASTLITSGGPPVPVAFRMSDARLRNMMPGIPVTPLRTGIERTLEIFRRLRAQGRLPSITTA